MIYAPVRKATLSLAVATLLLPIGGRPAAYAQETTETVPGWALWVGGALLAGSLLVVDAPVRDQVITWSGSADRVAGVGRWIGNWRSSAPYAVAGSFLIGMGTEGAAGGRKALAVTAGTLAGSMVSEVLNVAVGRRRPLEGQGSLSFRPFNGHASFPSGHTAFAFSLAGSIDAVTDGWAPAAAAYAAATLTGLSRMYDDKHWLSDVVAGALLGTLVSKSAAGATLRWLGGREEGDRTSARGGGAGESLEKRLRLSISPSVFRVAITF